MLCLSRWGEWWLGHYTYCYYWAFVVWIQSGYTITTHISGVSESMLYDIWLYHLYFLFPSRFYFYFPYSHSIYLHLWCSWKNKANSGILVRWQQPVSYHSRQFFYQCAASWWTDTQCADGYFFISSFFMHFKGNSSLWYLTRTKY